MSETILPNPRLEMPSLFYPKRKPIGNVRIDWSHSIGKKVVFSNINNAEDLASGEVGSLTDGAYLERGEIILPNGGTFSSGRNALRFFNNKLSGSGNISLLTRVWADSTLVGEARIMSSKTVWNSLGGFYIAVKSGGDLYARGSGTAKAATPTGVMPMNQWTTLLVHYAGASVSFYIDDVVLDGHTIGAIDTIKTSITIGHNTGNNDSGFKGRVESLSLFRGLTDRDIKSLLQNPYQFLIPQ
ncbi:MAG: hypothetical protein COA83_09670 [Methylophaga sp.]|nr:MAG: hypothetical protein COA83_09670 [Methylophaga sp.]